MAAGLVTAAVAIAATVLRSEAPAQVEAAAPADVVVATDPAVTG